MFSEIAASYNNGFSNFVPCPPASDRAAYEKLPVEEIDECLKTAAAYADFEFKEIPTTVFMEYVRNGNRSHFEDLNFSKRHALCPLIMAECIEHKGKYLDKIIEGIYSVCEETAWQLPAHNSYIRDSAAYILPDITDPVIDLFAAETGAFLAMASYLLHDEFEAVSPFINKMIKAKLKERIYEPYINRHFWWMGNGDEPMCNWTVWCTQNVLLSVFLNPDTDDSFRKEVFLKASKSIDCFLKDYGDDGCCEEGAHYYKHSALCLFNCTNILNAVSGGHFSSVFNENKIKNIATYIYNVNIHENYYFNFADCSAIIDRAGAREFLFAKAIGSNEMMRFAAKDYLAPKDNVNEKELNLFYCFQSLFAAEEISSTDISTPLSHKDIYYPSVGLFIAHDSHFSLAVKAGDNNDSHNHNDTGSVIIYKNGKPVLIDVGVETYSKKTFSDSRYEIWTMQSAFHNLPTINGVMQKDGAAFKATDVEYFLSDKICDIKMDIASAYPKEAGLSHYNRHVSLFKEKQIVIEDSVEFKKGDISDNSFFLSLMTSLKPAIQGNNIVLSDAKLQILGDALISYEVIPITDERLKWAWKDNLYRILITPKAEKITIVIQ